LYNFIVMADSNKIARDFLALKQKLETETPLIGINDEGKADAIFIEIREMIKKHYGDRSDYMQDYRRILRLKGSYTYRLMQFIPVITTIAQVAAKEVLKKN
jgi:hypothetical protein